MEQQEKENSPTPSLGGISAFASIALSLVGFYILIPLFGTILSSTPVLREWRMGAFFIKEGVMLLSVFVVIFLIMQFLDHRPFSDLGFSPKGRGKDILYGFLMAMFIYAIGSAVCLPTGQIEVVGVHFHWNDLSLSGLFFVMVAIVEETMMRGYILGRLLRTRLNKSTSLFISSFLFMLPHLMNPNVALLPMLNLVLGELLLEAVYLYTRNLWFPISLHSFWNWIQGPVLGFEVSGNCFCETLSSLRLLANNLISGGTLGFEGSPVCMVLVTLFTPLIIWWFEQ